MLGFALLLSVGLGEKLLVPMPDAKDVTRMPPMEHMSFQVPLACPDSGEVLHFYQQRLEAQGYRLCGSAEVEWKSFPTPVGESLSYQAVFVSDRAGKVILVSPSCSLTNGRTTATHQRVSLTLLHDQVTAEVERNFKVSCGPPAK
ncbi:MAG TPA: hypothetical protein VFV75_05075 [Candidatus Polarisedimenticolaceae bacterium]|nr:hypothetical protein [Candidatus Polarisedimenticolaceae bacterium]